MSKTNGEQYCNGDVLLKLQSTLYNLRRRYNHRQIEDFKKRFNTLIRFKLGFVKYFYRQWANIPDLTFNETDLLFFFFFFWFLHVAHRNFRCRSSTKWDLCVFRSLSWSMVWLHYRKAHPNKGPLLGVGLKMVIPAYQEIILPAVLLWFLGLVYPWDVPMYAWYVMPNTFDEKRSTQGSVYTLL